MTGYTGFENPPVPAEGPDPGDRGPFFVLPGDAGRSVSPMDDEHAGRAAVLVFRQGQGDPQGLEGLQSFVDRQAAFEQAGARIYVITRDGMGSNQALKAARTLPCDLLSDPEGKVFAAFGLQSDAHPDRPAGAPVVLDDDFRIAAMLGQPRDAASDGDKEARLALAAAEELERSRPRGLLTGHAPVLVLPRVLSPQDCARLIQVWRRDVKVWDSDGLTSRGHDEEAGDFKVRIENYGKILQHIIKEPALTGYLDSLLGRRINPAIQKAFQTKVSQREDYRIACYDAGEAGSLAAHRDNPTEATRHRRFTFTVALNNGNRASGNQADGEFGGGEFEDGEFEGGGLRFPEYGDQIYQVKAGTAIVWSAALLHEVPPLTRGRRFILGAHLYGT